MFIVKYRNIFLIISVAIAVIALVATIMIGLKQGIEFTGGTAVEVAVEGEVTKGEIENLVIGELPESSVSVQELGESGYIVRTSYLEDSERSALTEFIEGIPDVSVIQMSSVGPTIGAEMQRKSVIAVALVTLAIVMFVAFAFRKVSKPVSSWAYGVATILSQVFDIILAVGAFALFGIFFGAEVNSLFVIALLTVIGYSVNDTIIVFDRIRENLKTNQDKNVKEDFDTTVGRSVNETITRSINTSLTTSLALIALYIFGGEPTKIFSLTLLAGVIIGTYSSLFFASPLLLLFNRLNQSRQSKA